MLKKSLAILLASCMVLSLGACGGGASESAAETEAAAAEAEGAEEVAEAEADGEDPIRVAFLPFSMAEEFGIDVLTGVQNACDAAGYELIPLDPNADLQTETSQIEDMITEGVDAMIFAAIDGQAMDEVVKQAQEAGIVMVDYDCTLVSGITDVTVKSDDEAGGALAAEILAQKIGGEGTVVYYEESPGVGSGVWRNKGFREYMAENYPDIELIANRPAETGRAAAQTWAIDMLSAYPEIKGIFCYAGDQSIGAYYGVKELGREDVWIVGYDATPEQQEIMLNDGPDCQLTAAVALFPKKMGRICVESLTQYLNGEYEKESTDDIIYIEPGCLYAESDEEYVDEE